MTGRGWRWTRRAEYLATVIGVLLAAGVCSAAMLLAVSR